MYDRVYRRLSLRDLSMVVQMEGAYWEGFIREENARQFLSSPTNVLFACIEEGRVIGFAFGYELCRLDDAGDMLYIHAVEVLEGYRRQGIGRELMRVLKDYCRLRGLCRFYLFTDETNAAARALYRSCGGFENEGSRGFWFNDLD